MGPGSPFSMDATAASCCSSALANASSVISQLSCPRGHSTSPRFRVSAPGCQYLPVLAGTVLTGRSQARNTPSLVAHDSCHPVTSRNRAGDGPRPVRAGSCLALGFWPEGVQGLRRSCRVRDHATTCQTCNFGLHRSEKTVEEHPRTLSGPSPDSPSTTALILSGVAVDAGYSSGASRRIPMADGEPNYEFGGGEDELARLERQGRALAPATRMIFDAAGIRSGMRVLDLGCGPGDVTFVAADLVGPDGYVVGVDRSPEALAQARRRADNAARRTCGSRRATSRTRHRAGRSMRSSGGWC